MFAGSGLPALDGAVWRAVWLAIRRKRVAGEKTMAYLTRGMAFAGWLLIASHAGLEAERSARDVLRDAVEVLPRRNASRAPSGTERRGEPRVLPSVRESKRLGSEPVTLDASAGILL